MNVLLQSTLSIYECRTGKTTASAVARLVGPARYFPYHQSLAIFWNLEYAYLFFITAGAMPVGSGVFSAAVFVRWFINPHCPFMNAEPARPLHQQWLAL